MAESDAPQDVKGELAEMIRSFLGKKLDAVPPGLRTEISGTTYTVSDYNDVAQGSGKSISERTPRSLLK